MPARLQHPPDQGLLVDLQIEHEVRRDAEAVQLADPLPVDATNARTRHCREDVAIGQHDEAGLEGGDDLLLEPIGEIGRVQEHERELVQRVALLREIDRRGHQLRSRPSRLDDAVALNLEPFPQQRNLRRAAHAVRSFDGDDFARISLDREVRNAVAVVGTGRDSGGRAIFDAHAISSTSSTVFCICRCSEISFRNVRCCSVMLPLALTTLKPNSSTIRSYSSRTLP